MPLPISSGSQRALRAIEYLKKVLPDKYASMEMSPMRGGSGRVPIRLGDSLIAKAANMPRGLRENSWSRDYLLQNEGVIPKLEEISPDDDWIIQEFLKNNRGDPRRAIDLEHRLSDAYGWGRSGNRWESPEFRDQLDKEGLGILGNYGEGMIGDFINRRHWRFRGDQPVLVDSGALVSGANDPMPLDELREILDKRVQMGVMSPRMRSGFFDRDLPASFGYPAGRGIAANRKLGFAGGGLAEYNRCHCA